LIYNDGYILLFYDCPMVTKEDIRNYNRFRKKLVNLGYLMLQNSVYYKYIRDLKRIEFEINKIKTISISDSNVIALKITNKQFLNINIIYGLFNLIDRSENYLEY